jgi:hypothetical protein
MDRWKRIRLEVLRGESSKVEILRRERIHWETLKTILAHPEPPGYQLKEPRSKPKIGPCLERIAQIVEAVREFLRVKQEVFMPLVPRVGEAQVDFAYALAKVAFLALLKKVDLSPPLPFFPFRNRGRFLILEFFLHLKVARDY